MSALSHKLPRRLTVAVSALPRKQTRGDASCGGGPLFTPGLHDIALSKDAIPTAETNITMMPMLIVRAIII